jgi:hypothetical protein
VFIFVAFSLGCMNLSFGGRHEYASTSSDSELAQKGVAPVRSGDDVCVYYPTPFQSPPNLQFTDNATRDGVTITEQAADHFRVKNLTSYGVNIPWEARGVKAVPVVPVVPVAVVGSPTPQVTGTATHGP